MTRMTSREFNQDTARAKREAAQGPVIITDRGKPTYVLLSIDAYEKLQPGKPTAGDILALDHGFDIDFDPPKMPDPQFPIPDLA